MQTRVSAMHHWRDGGRLHPAAKIPRAAYPLAEAVGCQPKTAAHYLAKIGRLAAAVIHSYQRSGDHVGLARFLAQIETAKAGTDVVPLSDALERQAVQAAHEDVEAVLAYVQDASPAHRRQLLRAIYRDVAELTQLGAAIVREGERA